LRILYQYREMRIKQIKQLIGGITLVFFLAGCAQEQQAPNLVPNETSKAPNYWCTWYWQNYLIKAGEGVTNPDPQTVYTNSASRESLNEHTPNESEFEGQLFSNELDRPARA